MVQEIHSYEALSSRIRDAGMLLTKLLVLFISQCPFDAVFIFLVQPPDPYIAIRLCQLIEALVEFLLFVSSVLKV